MSEFVPGSLEDSNSTLDLEQRAANLVEVYHDVIPRLAEEGVTLDTALRTIHRIAIRGFMVSGLENVTERLAEKGIDATQINVGSGQYRDRSTTDTLGYKTTIKGVGYNELDGQFAIHIPCPREEVVPDLMEDISTRFDEMLDKVQGPEDAIKLAAWTSQLAFLVHPFYDGNGRASRAVFTYAAHKAGLPSLCIENQREDKNVRALPFLTGIAITTIMKLYARNMDSLPPYIPLSRNPVTANDIIGLPSYASADELNTQKQLSLERLLAEHLRTVTMEDVRELFTAEDANAYQENMQLLPS